VPAGRVISFKVFSTSLSESKFRKGDCRREMLSPVFRVSSNMLGLPPSTLDSKIRALKIDKRQFYCN
jgi:hypothetical protein